MDVRIHRETCLTRKYHLYFDFSEKSTQQGLTGNRIKKKKAKWKVIDLKDLSFWFHMGNLGFCSVLQEFCFRVNADFAKINFGDLLNAFLLRFNWHVPVSSVCCSNLMFVYIEKWSPCKSKHWVLNSYFQEEHYYRCLTSMVIIGLKFTKSNFKVLQ